MTGRTLQVWQHLLMAIAIVLLATFALSFADRSVSSYLALKAFDQARATGAGHDGPNSKPFGRDEDVDFSLWSEKRVRAYKDVLAIDTMVAVAVLDISKFRLRVPVFEGTDDPILNRGVGWIVGTGRPGEAGNIGLAGHRDGFFRGLKDIAVGDAVELTTLSARATYVVDAIEIVTPERVDVLEPRASPSLTLVTCYPFYFIGDAPQRFIVHASLDRTVPIRPSDGADQ